jgi:mono/diheme cytochrome c family protein
MKRSQKLGLFALGLAGAASAIALSATAAPESVKLTGTRVDNFMLPDQTGMGHELFYFKNAPAVVIVSGALGDETTKKAAAELAKLQKQYEGKNVHFMILNSSLDDSRDEIIAQAAELGVPMLADSQQLVGRSLGVTKTGEAFVVNPKTWTVAYHGPVADKNASVAGAIDALIQGKAPKVTEASVKGKTIAFPDRAKAPEWKKISYAKDVAPILQAKCVACHTEGGMGPFAMNKYETVKVMAPMIRESLRTKRMPPFHSDSHWGKWGNDMLLSADQIKTVVNWVEAGAPRGDGVDPLAETRYVPPEWPLGEPDVIVEIPAFDVPASGIIDYQDRSIATNFKEGKWLKATAWANASATVHHALAGWIPEVREDGRGFSWNTSLGGYGPGGEANLTPKDTGIYIPPGGSYAYQMHYTSTGKPITDKTKVGYYFYKETPKNILRQTSVTDYSLEIPAFKARHHETAYLIFPDDAEIFGTQPHCHSRCYSTKLTIRYPDGREEVLLNQPRYDFGWQREFHFEPMLQVPKGSMMIADYVFDNSHQNPANPDPKINVTFGEQTSEEMLFTFMRFRFKNETVDNRREDLMKELQTSVVFGAFDDDRNGEITVAELRNDPRFGALKGYIGMVDANKNGSLNMAEWTNAMNIMQNMRNRPGAAPAAGAAKPDAGADAMVKNVTGQ